MSLSPPSIYRVSSEMDKVSREIALCFLKWKRQYVICVTHKTTFDDKSDVLLSKINTLDK